MKLLLSLLLIAPSLFAGTTPVARGQNQAQQTDAFVRENNLKRAKNPEGLSFTIRFQNNKKQFYQGEALALEIVFAASAPKKFTLNHAGYARRSALSDEDEFFLDRSEGVVDPLDDYFNSQLFGFNGGSGGGMPELTEKPEIIAADLNEWFRFDRPGHYRLYVVSTRVETESKSNRASEVTSNVIEFDIVPANRKWSSQKLKEAVKALSKSEENHHAACKTLRFLGTEAAASEMVKRFRGEDDDCDPQFQYGLIGSPYRDLVIKEMENALIALDQPITPTFLDTLSLLEFTRQNGRPDPYPEEGEPADHWQAQNKERRRAYDQLHSSFLRQLLTATPRKEVRARATSLQTLLDYQHELNTSDSPQWAALIASVPDLFTRLPIAERTRLLTEQWQAVANKTMLPILRGILNEPLAKRDDNDQQRLRDIALRRLIELSPDEGRQLIIDEIRSLNPRFDQYVLGALPDKTLPELDNVLAANLEASQRSGTTDEVSQLIERYATGVIASQVQSFYETKGTGQWTCRTQAALLAYFLRVLPSLGAEYLKQALTTRGKGSSQCYASTLKDVVRFHMSAGVVDVAIASLDDEDPEVVSQAAHVVGGFGNAEAEKALWRRMEKWHDEMQSHREELSKQYPGVPTPENPLRGQAMIEQALRVALAKGQAWLLGPEKLKRLRDLCLTEQGRWEVDELISDWNATIAVDSYTLERGSPLFSLAHYQLRSVDSLKEKLLQFPKGTIFKWAINADGNDDKKAQEVFRQIKSYLEEHGMKLERVVEP